ncbi:MAG: HlyD family efflux transporter periplasmic adaptor subunit [Saprospiraceae bacterium]|nr:MAG: HlyD family efflux transporter periplasmic adaptor subunit [Saprospiraceae bacterium]
MPSLPFLFSFLFLAALQGQLWSQNLAAYLAAAHANSPVLQENQNLAAIAGLEMDKAKAVFKMPEISTTGNFLYAPVVEGAGYDAAITNGAWYSAQLNVNQAFFTRPQVEAQVKNSLVGQEIYRQNSALSQQAGEKVGSGQLLFTLETKEHRAINAGPDLKKSDLARMGVVSVHAPAGGVLLTLEQRQGDFVSEGSTLCTIARSDKIGFRLSVPYEFNNFVNPGTACTIELPDKTRLPGRVSENLNTAAITSQTQTFLVKPLRPVAVPEGLNVTVIVQTEAARQAVVLPKSAILTNETMDEFWVMRLVNDSTAVKVPVTLGLTAGEAVQVTSPAFSPKDRILTEGNYGLEDTALVKIKPRIE